MLSHYKKPLKKSPFFAYNRSMGIVRSRLYFGIVLFALCAAASAESKTKAAQAKREALIAEAKKYIGSPYAAGGVGPESFDCSGFIYFIARKSAKVQLPRSSHAIYRFVEHISDDEIEAGDLLFFSASSSGRMTHVGLYIGEGKMIHAASDGPKTGVIVSSLDEHYWKTYYVGAGRFVPSAKSAAGGKTSNGSDKQKTGAPSSGENSEKKTNGTTADAETAASGKSDKESGEKTVADSGESGRDESSEFIRTDTVKVDADPKKTGSDSGKCIDNFICSFSMAIDWSFFEPERFFANFRGIDSGADITFSKWKLRPGIGTMIKGYNGGAVLVPLVFILELNDNIRAYAGPAVTLGAPTFFGERTASPAFSGTFGVSFCTPPHNAGSVGIRFMQDISYTIFKKSDGSMFSFASAFCAGFALVTGIRISFPMRAFAGKRGT